MLWTAPGARLEERSFARCALLIRRAVAEAGRLLEEKPAIWVHGKQCHMQRSVAFLKSSDDIEDYKYSGNSMKGHLLTGANEELLREVNMEYGSSFNAVLINRYNDGSEYVGAHRDSEEGVDVGAGVVAISWGAERKFRVRKYTPGKAGEVLATVGTKHLYALQMQGPRFQKDYTHEIVAEKGVQGSRYSFTFRKHAPARGTKRARD